MKKMLVSVLLLTCFAGMALATNYNPLTDWVNYPGEPNAVYPWTFGFRVQTAFGSGAFGDFSPMEHIPNQWTSAPDGDAWRDPAEAPHYTCSVWKIVPWNPPATVGMMVWDLHSPVVRITPEPGIYDLTGSFIGIGYTTTFPATNVHIIKNNTDVLFTSSVSDYTTPVPFNVNSIEIVAGDYLEFIAANTSSGGPEHRAALTADLVARDVLLAWGPSPEDGAADVNLNTSLCWNGPSNDPNYPDPNGNFFSYNVYYGHADDLDNLAGPILVTGGEPHCYTPAIALDQETEYAWRVDVLVPEPAAPGGVILRTGDVWTFTTGPAYDPAELVSPTPSGVTGVAYDAILDWNNTLGVEWANVYFSTNETLVVSRDPSVQVASQTTDTSYDPFGVDLMDPNTIYYWVVDEGIGTEVVTAGAVWSFTTKAVECLAPVAEWDINGDCTIDLAEFAELASLWLQCGYDHPGACQ